MNPANIPYFISLTVTDELSAAHTKAWFALTRDKLPEGVRTSIQTQSPDNGLISVPMVCMQGKGSFAYYIPLTRHILEVEAEPIVHLMAREFPGDFEITVSKSDLEDRPAEEMIKLKSDKYDAVCRAFAKRQHDDWVTERLKRGWRYSTEMSMVNKTSPMLKPWDELPEALRQVDYEHPQTLVDLLNDQGYTVIRKEELSAILSLLRNTP